MDKTAPKIDYDKYADVLYVTFGTGEPSYCEEFDDFLLLEVGIFSNFPVGFRIVGLKEAIKSDILKKMKPKIEDAIKTRMQKFGVLDMTKRAFKEIEKKELVTA